MEGELRVAVMWKGQKEKVNGEIIEAEQGMEGLRLKRQEQKGEG